VPNQQLEQDLGVRLRSELDAVTFERASQFGIVIDLAVEHERVPAGRIDHGLPASLTEVNYREPTMDQRQLPGRCRTRIATDAEPVAGPGQKADIVRAPVRQQSREPVQQDG
jgi:hypothetical protein